MQGVEWAEVVVKFHTTEGGEWTFYVPHLETTIDGRSLGEIQVEPIYDETENKWLNQYRSTLEAILLTTTLHGHAKPDAEGSRYYYIKGDPDV